LLNGGFLERTPDGEGFRLGPRVAALGREALRFAQRNPDVRRIALPYMQQLVERFQESCTLVVFDRDQAVLLEIVHSRHALTVTDKVGGYLPTHCTASGKVLLAFLPPAALEPILNAPLAAFTEKTITSPDRLREEFKVVRQRGYALNDEEFEVGLRAISAPIWDIDGKPIAALSMPGPASRITPERIPEIAQALVEATEAVSGLCWPKSTAVR
jgi:IclR family KDG regulon transcriptional repressor